MIEASSLYPNLPVRGAVFRSKELTDDGKSFFVKDEYLKARRSNTIMKYLGWVPGAGGDVWWMEHADGTVGAYCYVELYKLESGDEGFVEVA